MTTVCEKGKCTGCMECIDICPKKAIKVIDSSYNCYYAYKWQYRLNVPNIEEVFIRLCSENKLKKTVKCLVLYKLKYSVLESGIRLAC